MRKELHIFLNKKLNERDAKLISHNTKTAMTRNCTVIYTSCTEFCSTDTLDLGYTLVLHFSDGTCTELNYGTVDSTEREIRKELNLEKLLLANEFGPVTPCQPN